MRDPPLNVLIFGATGMVGQGVLHECLTSSDVDRVVSVGRSAGGQQHPKLHEVVQANLADLAGVQDQLSGFDACFFCLGVSAAGMSEEAYRGITYNLTLSIAKRLLKSNPRLTFVYVSGMGTDRTEKGRTMWARVKGATENALLAMPFHAAYMFRPGIILPSPGAAPSKTAWYRVLYATLRPVGPVIQRLFPRQVMTTAQLGRAMLEVARRGNEKRVLEAPEIVALSPNEHR